MAHPQIVHAHIEGKDFTLNYDYDQLRDCKLSELTDNGKIEWFRLRMKFVFLEPLSCLYQGKTTAYRALNSTKPGDLPARSFVIASFSVLLNGIEALGSFLTASDDNNVRFYTFIRKYMNSWDAPVPALDPTANLKKILWKDFRNGIAHGFRIQAGGIDNEADTPPGWRVVTNTGPSGSMSKRLEIGPNAFFGDFKTGVDCFFADVGNDPSVRATFLTRFQEVYPT